MVGQEILVLFIMVRIRAPQPKIKTPLWRFYFWFVATVRGPQPTVAGSKTSRFDKHTRSQIVTVSPRSPRAVRGNPCAPGIVYSKAGFMKIFYFGVFLRFLLYNLSINAGVFL